MSGEILGTCDECGREMMLSVEKIPGTRVVCGSCYFEMQDRPAPSPGLAPPRPVGCPSCAQAEAEVDRLKAALDLEARARKAAADGLADAKAERVILVEAIERFASYVVTCHERNTPEWMEGLAEEVNEILDSIGESDRFEFRRGMLAKIQAFAPLPTLYIEISHHGDGYPDGFHHGHDTFEERDGER